MTRRSGPKAALQITTPITIHPNSTAVARLEAAQAGLTAGIRDPQLWDPGFTVEAAIVLIDAAIRDLAVV